jgi:hypothetical protein
LASHAGACALGVDIESQLGDMGEPVDAAVLRDASADATATVGQGQPNDAGAVVDRDAAQMDGGSVVSPTPDAGSGSPDATAGQPVQDGEVSGDAGQAQPDSSGGGGAEAGQPPLSCAALARTGVQLCSSATDSCGVVFTDGSGCSAICAAVGMACAMAYENVEGQCARDESRPALPCDSAHESDYCVCRRP